MDNQTIDNLALLSYRMECGVAVLSCIQEAMEHSGDTPYSLALLSACESLHNILDEWRRLLNLDESPIDEQKGIPL